MNATRKTILEAGYKSVAQFCRESGIKQENIYAFGVYHKRDGKIMKEVESYLKLKKAEDDLETMRRILNGLKNL